MPSTYRPALGVDVALEELMQNKGVLYDEDVVGACISLVKGNGFVLDDLSSA